MTNREWLGEVAAQYAVFGFAGVCAIYLAGVLAGLARFAWHRLHCAALYRRVTRGRLN